MILASAVEPCASACSSVKWASWQFHEVCGEVNMPSPRSGALWALGVLPHTLLLSSASPTVPREVLQPQEALRRCLLARRTSSRRHRIMRWALSIFRTSPHLPTAPLPVSKLCTHVSNLHAPLLPESQTTAPPPILSAPNPPLTNDNGAGGDDGGGC